MNRFLSLLLILCIGVMTSYVYGQRGRGAANSSPAEPEISVRFDRDAVVAGEPFRIEVTVKAEGRNEPEVKLPSTKGLDVLKREMSRPQSSFSWSFSMGTGSQSKTVSSSSGVTKLDLVVVAKEVGKYVFGPVTVLLDGHTFLSSEYPFEVFESDKTSSSVSGSVQQTGTVDLEGAKIDSKFFVHMIPSKKEVFEGELVVLDVFLFTSVGGIRFEQYDREPGTEGFWVERFEDFDLRNFRNRNVVINNKMYEQVILRRLALFPLKTGDLKITPTTITINEATPGFLGMVRGNSYKLTSSPVSIKVNPLPAGAPQGFDSSSVGQFNFFVNASSQTAKIGEPVTVTVTVRGNGNIRNITLPQLETIDGLRLFPPESDLEINARNMRVSGMKQNKILIIPQAEGAYEIPSLNFSYFNPESNRYEQHLSDSISLVVKGGTPIADSSDFSAHKSFRQSQGADSLAVLNSQLRTIENKIDVSTKNPVVFKRWWYGVLFFGVFGLFLGYLLVIRILDYRKCSIEKGRSKSAASVAQKALHSLNKESSKLSNDEYFSKLHRIFISFLEDKFEERLLGDTMPELSARLSARGLDKTMVEDIITNLEEFEFARFASSSKDNTERKKQEEQIKALILTIGNARISPTLKREKK